MVPGAGQAIAREVTGWPGVTTSDTGRMGTAFHVGKIELGHLHGDHAAHVPFPKAMRDQLLADGTITPHPVFPDAGWGERVIRDERDVSEVIALFRANHERARARQDRSAHQPRPAAHS